MLLLKLDIELITIWDTPVKTDLNKLTLVVLPVPNSPLLFLPAAKSLPSVKIANELAPFVTTLITFVVSKE
jgi:hypothetical protein